MPHYDYACQCGTIIELFHMMSDDTEKICPNCQKIMQKQIGMGYLASKGMKPTLEDHKESEHNKKVKDPERAVKMRKKAFGHDAVGDPSYTTDPRHIVKRGRTIAGQQKEVDRQEFIKSAAKDDYIVDKCLKAQNKEQKK